MPSIRKAKVSENTPRQSTFFNSRFAPQNGSDSGAIDNEGHFVSQAFENIFAKYDRENRGCLSLADIFRMMKGQRVAADPFGVSDQLHYVLRTTPQQKEEKKN